MSVVVRSSACLSCGGRCEKEERFTAPVWHRVDTLRSVTGPDASESVTPRLPTVPSDVCRQLIRACGSHCAGAESLPRTTRPVRMETPLTPLDFLRRARKLHGSREAVIDGDLRLTYEAFGQRCDRWSSALAKLGVKQGDRVATLAPNTHQHLEQYYAVPQLGAVIVPMNYRLVADDFVYLANHSGTQGPVRACGLPGYRGQGSRPDDHGRTLRCTGRQQTGLARLRTVAGSERRCVRATVDRRG